MSGIPKTVPAWATSANYSATEVTDPHHNTPTQVEPSSGAKANGFEPRYRLPAQVLNWLLAETITALRALVPIVLANWTIRAHATTGTPTAAAAVATRAFASELDGFMAIFSTAGDGRAQRSPDGVSWTDLSGSLAGTLYGVAYMGGAVGQWLIAASGGVIFNHAKNTGGAWTAAGPGSGDDFKAVAANSAGTLAVAVGDSGRLYSSANGTSWTSRTSGSAADLAAVAYGAERWVAAGSGGSLTVVVITSTNGTTWTPLLTTSGGGSADFTHVIFDEASGKFLCFDGAVVSTVDAATGTVMPAVGSVPLAPTAVAADGSGTIVAVSGVLLYVSTDAGETWSAASLLTMGTGVLTTFNGLVYSEDLGCLVAVGEDGSAAAPIVAQSMRTA